jgi:hypothetical protein
MILKLIICPKYREFDTMDKETGTITLDASHIEKIPDILKQELYIHQQNSIKRLREIEDRLYKLDSSEETESRFISRILVLSDPVGSGKTITTIARLIQQPDLPLYDYLNLFKKYTTMNAGDFKKVEDNVFWGVETQEKKIECSMAGSQGYNMFEREALGNNFYYIRNFFPKPLNHWKVNIILVPHNVVSHWRDEFLKRTTLVEDKDFITIRGAKKMPSVLGELAGIKYIILSTTAYGKFLSMYYSSCASEKRLFLVSRFIIDEAHTLKQRKSINIQVRVGDSYKDHSLTAKNIKIPSLMTWFVSSSFDSLRNATGVNAISENFSKIYDNPHFMSKILVMNGQKNIDISIKLPKKFEYNIKCGMNRHLIGLMKHFMGYFANTNMKRYLHSGDESLVKNFLLTRFDHQDETSKTDEEEEEEELNTKRFNDMSLEDAIEQYIEKMQKNYEVRLQFVNQRQYASARGKEQAVNNVVEQQNTFNMNVEAYHQYLRGEKATITKEEFSDSDSDEEEDDIEIIKQQVKDDLFENKALSKADKIERLLQYLQLTDPKFKILLFSDYDGIFETVAHKFDEQGLKYERVSGSADHIKELIERFNNGDLNVMYMNSKHMGFGMNLQSATDILMVHQMDHEKETQVIGRAYRIGKETPLRVWRLMNENE